MMWNMYVKQMRGNKMSTEKTRNEENNSIVGLVFLLWLLAMPALILAFFDFDNALVIYGIIAGSLYVVILLATVPNIMKKKYSKKRIISPNCERPEHFELIASSRGTSSEFERKISEMELSEPIERHVIRLSVLMNEVLWDKRRGWFYPTRYNERPGRYEDEVSTIWICNPDHEQAYNTGRQWIEDGGNTWYAVPVDAHDENFPLPIAVRWIGELDD